MSTSTQKSKPYFRIFIHVFTLDFFARLEYSNVDYEIKECGEWYM